MKNCHPVTQGHHDTRLIALVDALASFGEIAAELGCHAATVSRRFERLHAKGEVGVQPRGRRRHPVTLGRHDDTICAALSVRRDRYRWRTLAVVAAELGCSEETVRLRIKAMRGERDGRSAS